MQRPWRGVTYCLAPHGLLGLLSYRTQDHSLGMAPPTVGGVLHHQSLIKEMPYRVACSPILGHIFFS